MSQPQYAALAFTNECSFCGGYTNLKVEPKLRVRLCEPCRASELVEVFSFKANEDLDLIRHLSLTLRGPTVSSKGTGDGGLPRSSGHNALCLRRDLQNFCDTRERFLRSGDENGLKRWERELSDLVGVHDQFAEMLQRFLLYPELTPMQKAWQKAGERVDRIPNVDESVFFNNYDTDVEGQVSDEDDEDTEQDDTDRRYFFHAQLQRVKPLAHPFRTVLEALGVKIDPLHAVFGPGPSTPRPSKEIEDYPFPTTATVLSWPCLSTFRELKSFQISNYFWDELGHIVHHVEAWRENGEQELVEWWKSGMEPTAELANPIVKANNHRQIDHYREASQMWTGFQSRTPEFKTRHPLKFVDVHDLYSVSAPKPFVRRLTKEEVTSLTKSPPLDVHKGFCCILCRNYGVRHVFKNLVSIWAHMNDVHGIVNPVVGLHYASGALGASFSSWGQKWRDSWDSHQAAREWDL
ncbi:hypothetical protein FRC06_002415 [Ceratobasidium sp. 370]|nr:hypothetical protein FRC06_002415 [Ceratobasidium sp. 370]